MPLHVIVFLGHEANVNARGDRNRTPLLLALGGKKVAIVRLLLEHGADVSAKGADWDETPLHLASENGELKIMSLLLKHGADVDARDSRNRTPLHMALGSANPPKIPRELLTSVFSHFSFQGFLVLVQAKQANKVEK